MGIWIAVAQDGFQRPLSNKANSTKIIAGFVTSINLSLPIILGSSSILIGWLIFKTLYKENIITPKCDAN